ncbi:GNAT family N-acetyltransferase [Deinococcus sp.]|uniref:GNAT family N-acetyltransferase n=1 Tax=Deinococcus sp. TaxID=47478 RepID=UPI0025DD4129|nr:GNAT family N-acetyltransferase [Deinococcus sp.]
MTQAAPTVLRELSGQAEFGLTLGLARAIWGEADQPEAPALLQVVRKTGGLVAGVFSEDGALQAYLVGLPTSDARVQHSHRLGVHPDARRRGLAERLKLFQRQWCLERGIHEVRWTFDPLLIANAHLNIHRLGATVSSLLPDYYGAMPGINAGLPSDRFEADWRLGSERVERHLSRAAVPTWPDPTLTLNPLLETLSAALPDALALDVPADFARLRRQDPALALVWRLKARAVLSGLFDRGYVLTDVDLSREQYLFTRGARC